MARADRAYFESIGAANGLGGKVTPKAELQALYEQALELLYYAALRSDVENDIAAAVYPTVAKTPSGEPLNKAVVGMALKPGQLPERLRPGDHVMVVRTAPAGAAATGADGDAAVLVRAATVSAVETLADSSGTVVVSLTLEQADAPTVAGASSAGRISLVLVP